MTLNGLLKHTCTITPITSATNRLNESSKTDGTPVTGVACFLQAETVKSVSDERAELLAVDNYNLFLKPTQTIKKGYKVSSIQDSEGNDVLSGTWFVETVALHGSPKKKHHQTVMLRK